MNKLVVLIVLLALLGCVQNRPVGRQRVGGRENGLRKAVKFLFKFGYLDISNSNDSASAKDKNSPAFKNAIKRLQRFGNIPMTGNLDNKTLELLSKSRCGMKDPNLPDSRRSRRNVGEFNLQGSSWKKKALTYKIINFTSDGIPPQKQRQIFREALNLWQSASTLSFTERNSGYADILISYVTKDHRDGYPFDGSGGTLAHAFYPHNNEGLSGDAHFDDDERFTTGTSDGINLDWVAVHEFGHSLGLEHSNVRESIMFPWYTGYVANIRLTNDDTQGIQALYPKPTMRQTPSTVRTTTKATTTSRPRVTSRPRPVTPRPSNPGPVTPRPAVPNLCHSSVRYDAVFVGPSGLTYFFVGDHFWILSSRLRRRGPHTVKSYWNEVKTPVDAAYLNKRGNIVFFKGTEFWEYNNERELQKSGHISRYFKSPAVTDIDAIFVWQNKRKTKKTYLFKGSQYWRYNEDQRKIDRGYPRPIRVWRGFPNDIDAAVTWVNDRSYIFKGGNYWRLFKGLPRVNQRRYPQKIDEKWMKCNTNVGGLAVGSLGDYP